mmetsp:Transcript_5888/g.14754  ORF Transcript_5888/g.14754 Transcript_5888/m.14754 type:complete len:92 (-) Transcript_5888:1163-1438(-)
MVTVTTDPLESISSNSMENDIFLFMGAIAAKLTLATATGEKDERTPLGTRYLGKKIANYRSITVGTIEHDDWLKSRCTPPNSHVGEAFLVA